jgi:KipI family sensor histidine kinase inhibitor
MVGSITPVGDHGYLVELPGVSGRELRGALAAVRSFSKVRAVLAGHSSLLLITKASIEEIAELLQRRTRIEEGEARIVEIPVNFSSDNAPDLPLLMERSGMSREQLEGRISELQLTVRYLGFLPGFAYMEGWPSEWALPRRATPRGEVPSGSFAVAGEMAGFYPGSSPGGWNLLGRTGERLWDPSRDRPNLLAPGDLVRIIPSDRIEVPASGVRELREILQPAAEVVSGGQWSCVVSLPDVGRLGRGLPVGGGFDVDAMRRANRAVGNPESTPVIECAMVGPALRFLADGWIAWSGATAVLEIDGKPANTLQLAVREGQQLRVGPLVDGMRGSLALRGGWDSGEGEHRAEPARLTAGDVLGNAGAVTGDPRISSAARPGRLRIGARIGPHPVSDEQREFLLRARWRVDSRLDRRGVRLVSDGRCPEVPALLPSSGMIFGSVQWHPDGSLMLLGPDHPVTGGYLQPLTILAGELWKVAQLRPGEGVEIEFGV